MADGPPAVDPKVALALALAGGQTAYVYTGQWRRLVGSTALSGLALAGMLSALVPRLLARVDWVELGPADMRIMLEFLGWLLLLCVLNNMACALDVWWRWAPARR